MAVYTVEVTATTTYKVEVEAASENEALRAVESMEYSDMIEVDDKVEFNVISDDDDEYGIEADDEEEDETEEK